MTATHDTRALGEDLYGEYRRPRHHHHWIDDFGGITHSHPLSLVLEPWLDEPTDRPPTTFGPPCTLPCEAAGAEVWT